MTALFVPPQGFELRLGFAHPGDPAFIAAFYPEGMPAEWRANYLLLMADAVVLNPAAADFADTLAACAEAPQAVQGVWAGVALPTDDLALALPLVHWVAGAAWTPSTEVNGVRLGLLAPGLSPRALRQALEDFARQAPAQPCVLLMDGGAAAIPLFEQTRSMLKLMGW